MFKGIADTLRRLGGRQPLCGIGVTSLMDLTVRPAAASACGNGTVLRMRPCRVRTPTAWPCLAPLA